MCVKVTYADGMEDLIEANEYHGERHQNKEVYKGRLASTNGKAVVILNPNPEGKDLVVFKCDKVSGCTKFRVDLEVKIFYGITKDLLCAALAITFTCRCKANFMPNCIKWEIEYFSFMDKLQS